MSMRNKCQFGGGDDESVNAQPQPPVISTASQSQRPYRFSRHEVNSQIYQAHLFFIAAMSGDRTGLFAAGSGILLRIFATESKGELR